MQPTMQALSMGFALLSSKSNNASVSIESIQEQQFLCLNCSYILYNNAREVPHPSTSEPISPNPISRNTLSTTDPQANMTHQRQQKRSSRPQQLKGSEHRFYTSFKDLGLTSPEQDEFESHGNQGTGLHQGMAEQAGKAEGSGRRETEIEKGEGTRQRSGSMRLMEWFMRPRSSSSPP